MSVLFLHDSALSALSIDSALSARSRADLEREDRENRFLPWRERVSTTV